MSRLEDIQVVILCGGLGRRLRAIVNDRPKPMALINSRPFLDMLIGYLRKEGFNKFILSAGYRSGKIKEYFSGSRRAGVNVLTEKELLGTGGAVKKARRQINGRLFMVVNGDSFCPVNFGRLVDFHKQKRSLCSMVLTRNADKAGSGMVKIGKLKEIISFREKQHCQGNLFINAGIYLFDRRIFSFMPATNIFSLEHDLFPAIINRGFYGFISKGLLIDIGTPGGWEKANNYFREKKIP